MRQSRYFTKVLLHLVEQLEHPLERLFRLVGMQIAQAGQPRRPFVPLGVVFHRTRAERIEVRIDRHVLRRKIRKMPHHTGFRKLRQGRGPLGQRRRRQQFLNRLLLHITLRQPRRTPARLGEFKQKLSILSIFHWLWLLIYHGDHRRHGRKKRRIRRG